MLQPSDAQSRIGELFCHLSVGALQTAVTVWAQLGRRDPNPFLHDLDLTARYGDAREAHRLRVQALLQVSPSSDDAVGRALFVPVLWYLGERDEAMVAARNLTRDFPDTPHAGWLAMMRDARAALAAEHGRPGK